MNQSVCISCRDFRHHECILDLEGKTCPCHCNQWLLLDENDENEGGGSMSNIDTLARPDWSHYGEIEDLWNEIVPGLWQGGTDDLDVVHEARRGRSDAQIQEKHFDTVITLYAWAQPVDWFVKELRYGFWDSDEHPFPIERVLEVAQDAYIEWQSGRKVLIRCQAGWNRSGLITALVLMMAGYPADEAISLIREKRSKYALCNRSFEAWLRNLDQDTLRKLAA